MDKRTWISATGKTEKGKGAQKSVVKSDYSTVRRLAVDGHGSGSTIVRYELTGAWMDELEFEGRRFNRIEIPSAGIHTQPGHPAVAQEGLFVAIPPNSNVTNVVLKDSKERELDGKFDLIPVSEPVIEGKTEKFTPDPNIYGKDEEVPRQTFALVGEKRIAGRKVAHILVYPVKYNPKSQKITLIEYMELEISFVSKSGMDCSPDKQGQSSSAIWDALVIGSDEASSTEDKLARGIDAISEVPDKLKDPNNKGDFLIITTNDLAAAFGDFIDVRNLDHTVKLATLEEIKAEFPAGGDDVSIKNFLTYAYNNWALRPKWVVLGGDVDSIPTHMMPCVTWDSAPHPDQMASDHYYADVAGDILPDLLVGRFPANNAETMKQICARAIIAEHHGNPWRDRVVLTTYQRNDYEECKDTISTTIDNDNRRDYVSAIKLYGSDPEATKAKVMETLNERNNDRVAQVGGVDLVNYRGHGSQDAWSAANGMNKNDVVALKPGNKTPLILSICCLNNFIDWTAPCFGETWITDLKSHGFWGASRPSYTQVNHKFDRFLWEGIIDDRHSSIGEITQVGTSKLWLNDQSAAAKENIHMYLLLGDPSADAKRVRNYSVAFNGSDNSYASVPDTPAIRTPNQLTVEVLMKAKSFNSGNWQDAVVSKHGDQSGWELRVGEAIPRMMVTVGGIHYYAQPDNPSTSPKLQANRWYFLAGTFDGNTIKMYVDGELWFSGSVSGNITEFKNAMVFGKNANPAWDRRAFNGSIASVALWKTTRSQQQIRGDIFDNILGDDVDRENGLLGYWAMNEGLKNTLQDQSRTHANPLSTENSGTINNGEWEGPGLNFLFDGTYDCATKYGGETGKWNPGSTLTLNDKGEVTFRGKQIKKPLVETNRIAWCIQDGNTTEALIQFMLGSDSSYFWPSGYQGKQLFQGWVRDEGPSGRLDFRGSIQYC